MVITYHHQWCSSFQLLCSNFSHGGGKLSKVGGCVLFKRKSDFPWRSSKELHMGSRESARRIRIGALVDPWSPTMSMSIASQLFAASLLPYLGFLYFITKSKSAPNLTLFGFYFLLAFVGATIPAGIYGNINEP